MSAITPEECVNCHEKAIARCMICRPFKALCLDHWLGHVQTHGIRPETVLEAKLVDEALDKYGPQEPTP